MSLQADIHWVQNEVAQIRDIQFMARVKELLAERPSKIEPMSYEELEEELRQAEEDIKAERVYTTESLRKHFTNRLAR